MLNTIHVVAALSLIAIITAPLAVGAQPEEGADPAVAEKAAVAKTSGDDKIGIVLAPKVGGIVPTNKLGPTYFLGIEIGYMPPALRDALGLPLGFGIEVSYAEPAHAGAITSAEAGSVDFTLDQRLITVGVEAFLQMPMGDLTPYGGIGYGVYMLQATASAFDQENVETQVRSGMQLRAGAGYRLGPGDLFGELRYHYANLEFATTGAVNAGGVTVNAGYRLVF